MSKLKHLIIHCTATLPGLDVCKHHIEQWHLAPANRGDGLVFYNGKFTRWNKLPDIKIGGVPIKELPFGRGWTRLGYSDLIKLDGTIENITPYNDDDVVDYNEMTWGVAGINGVSRHIVYAGGVIQEGKKLIAKDTRTPEQLKAMEQYVKRTIELHPQITIAGHNQFANKACPSFVVPLWLKSIGVKEENIFST